jgi:hypothetical protein
MSIAAFDREKIAMEIVLPQTSHSKTILSLPPRDWFGIRAFSGHENKSPTIRQRGEKHLAPRFNFGGI